jgi:hypothetical protein
MLAMVMSLITAHVFYLVVERPSIRLASWVKKHSFSLNPAMTAGELAYLKPSAGTAAPALTRD